MIGVYPGSFDPVTNGHLDIIHRCAKKFDKLIVAILNNPSKHTMFSVEERTKILQEVLKDCHNVEVDSFSGLLVDYVKRKNANVLVRGLRAVSDFEYEMQMALMNRSLDDEIETFFLISSNQYSFLSSSLVKEVALFKGDIKQLVPKEVEEAIIEKSKK